MSQGAIFKLVLRDERFDKFFTASDYLRQRLDAVRQKRLEAGEPNIQPTFVDIERSHILYVHSTYRPYVTIASEYARVKAAGDSTASIGPSGGSFEFTFPIYGHFTSDMAIHVKIKPIGSKTAFEGEEQPTAATPLLRFCAFPGIRMFKKIELKSTQTLIDDYVPDDVVAYSKFFVHSDQRVGWDRCFGQQEERQAVFEANNYTGTLFYRDGPQTSKLYHEEINMFIPLQFDFCRDAARAMLNDLIPNTQRTITCELAPIDQIVKAVIHDPQDASILLDTPLPFSKLAIDVMLYVNGLYVNPEIHDIFASRIGFNLIRVHRRQLTQLQNFADSFLLSQLKYPIEYMMVGFRDRDNAKDFDQWWLMGSRAERSDLRRLLVPAMIWNPVTVVGGICQLVCREAKEISTLESSVEDLGVTAHGVDIFPSIRFPFYNAYMPIRYAENSMVVAPLDTSAFLINFCLYPGKHTPSGYYNLSAGREMYINYRLKPSAADIQPGSGEMVVSASALNYLYRKGDQIHLRYAL